MGDLFDLDAERARIMEKVNDALFPSVSDKPSVQLVVPDNPITRLVVLAKGLGTLGHGKDGTPYLRIPGEAWREPEFLDIRSKPFREKLLASYYGRYQETPSTEVVQQGIEVIAGLALLTRSRTRSPKRYAVK